MSLRYTARDSRIDSGCVGQPLNLRPACIAKLFKFSYFGIGCAWLKLRAPPCHLPILKSLSVYLLLTLMLCSCGMSPREVLRVGIDPNWYLANFGAQTSYVNGYTEDLLLEMSMYSGIHFELVRANSDNLLDGINEGKYDAVMTTLPPYEYNLAKYSFSENVLDLGPVLIVPYQAKKNTLEKLENDLIGIIANAPAEQILAEYPTIVIRQYPTIPDLLNAVVARQIDGALLEQIPAVNYISDLYAGVLEIQGKPLTQAGVHLVGPKGRIGGFNSALKSLRKKKVLENLKKKWELALGE